MTIIKKCEDCGKILGFLRNYWYHPVKKGCYLCDDCRVNHEKEINDLYFGALKDCFDGIVNMMNPNRNRGES